MNGRVKAIQFITDSSQFIIHRFRDTFALRAEYLQIARNLVTDFPKKRD